MSKAMEIREKLLDTFQELHFEEKGHVYTLRGNVLPSVSSQLQQFYKPFDTNIAKYVAGKGKYAGMTEAQVRQAWKDKGTTTANEGTRIHKFGEDYAFTCVKPTCEQELGVVQWWMDLPNHIVPVAMELQVFIDGLFAGTIDIVLYNLWTNKIILADYKSNADLFKNYKNQKLYEPFEDMLDTPYNKYQLQLSHYHTVLEHHGFPVEARWIIWLTRDLEKFKFYKQYDCTDFTEEVKKFYKL